MMRTWAIVTSLLVVLATAGLAGDAGTRSPFSLGAGARDLALGGAVASGADPATSVYWNPSLLARVDRISVTGFHTGLYGSSTGYQYVGVAVPTLDLGGFGAGLFRLGVDDIERRDANNLYLGDFGESRLAFYLGYGRSLGAYDLGLAVSLEHQTFDATSATSSPGLDLAVAREIRTDLAWLPEASLGLDARNILRPAITLQSDAVRYPSALDAGVALNVIPVRKWNQMLTLRAQLTTVSHLDPELAMGLEYSLDDRLHLRAGVRGGQTSFGAGVCYQSISIDYALVERDLGSIQTVSISASLGMPKSQKRRAREEEREAQFNRLLETRLAAQNREAVTRLVAESESLVTAGSLGEASTMIERACLLAGGSGAEADSGVYAQAQDLRTRLDSQLAERAYAAYMDSAQAKLAARDYLSAKYFAELALTKHGGSAQADSLLGEADAAIAQGASEHLVFESRLRMADSLVSYGRYEEALAAARALADVAGSDSRVATMVKKAEFGYWQDAAEIALSRGELPRARAAVDSALGRFPDQPDCVALRGRIEREMRAEEAAPTRAPEARPSRMDETTRRDVEAAYVAGQSLFKGGHLAEAVAAWEKVETLAPNYQSVRTYLVNGYKYLGVELYTQNHLQEAVDVWRKAAKLEPTNAEIANYIRRTEGEMARMRDLSYEHR